MRLNILIGGKAGQGINAVSELVSAVLTDQGYFIFNYRDYPSLIRGGHNFNILSISDKQIASFESKLDAIVALDEKTLELHKQELKKDSCIIDFEKFKDHGRNLNIALAGALIKILGIDLKILTDIVKSKFKTSEALKAAKEGFESQEKKYNLTKQNNNILILSGSQAVAQGALNSDIDLYIAYPMTPATGVMNELAAHQEKVNNHLMVFQAESEIAVANSALGASFSGAKTMIGTSGGGFDLMTEALSLQGISEIPLTVYLASRPGPGTGVPTYSAQCDLNIALKAGHGEFPRVVIAPGDIKEAIENTNQAMYLSEKFRTLSIVLSDKHLAESQFSFSGNINKPLKVEIKRPLPGEEYQGIVKASSYEHDNMGNTSESLEIARQGANGRLENYKKIQKECEKFEMIKLHKNNKQNSKNLILAWGSTKGVILDSIEGLDCQFLQIIYLKPMSKQIKEIMQNAENLILIETNSTGQLGYALREKTGISIPAENRILKYNSRPFTSDELKLEIQKRLK